ncbi:MAG: redoxin domain-containing protein [Planctomycetes bacterium]|nr:redoxin domain-containing protein [Planctomycetota bacterium]
MKAAVTLTTCVAILLANVAYADLEVGAYAPDIEAEEWLNTDDPVSLGDLRGMVVVLFFWVSYHGGGQDVMQTISLVEANPGLGRARGVIVIGLTEATRDAVQKTLEDEKVFFPVGVGSKSHEDYKINSFPRVVIIDANGKVAWSGWPGQANEMVQAVLRVIGETPPRKTHPLEAAKCHQFLDEARTALRQDHYQDAFQAGRSAFEHALTGDPLKTLCQDMLDLVDALGEDQLAAVDDLVAKKDFAGAVRSLRTIARDFRGMDVSKAAKDRLDSLKKEHDEVATILASQQSEAEARGLLLKAREDTEGRQFGPAYEKLERILTEFGDTLIAADAAAVKQRMERNEDIMAYVRDYRASKECDSWMAQARSYERASRYEQARQIYRRILDKYPDTKYSERASRALIDLP